MSISFQITEKKTHFVVVKSELAITRNYSVFTDIHHEKFFQATNNFNLLKMNKNMKKKTIETSKC